MKMKAFVVFWIFAVGSAKANSSSAAIIQPSSQTPIGICGHETEINLQSNGEAASFTITLDALPTPKSICRLRVTAPKTHVVNLQFIEDGLGEAKNSTNVTEAGEQKGRKMEPCLMSIYLPDNTRAPFWKGDPCSGQTLPEVDLLTNDFKIIWNPPGNHSSTALNNSLSNQTSTSEDDLGLQNATKHHNETFTSQQGKGNFTQRTFVLTAIGSGTICKEPFQHTCMRIGRIPMLCISDHLLCDGHQNCPKSSTSSDEDPKLCKTAKNAWQNFVVELVKKYRPPQPNPDGKWTLKPAKNASESVAKWLEWQPVRKGMNQSEVVEEHHNAAETISAMLNKYGPWGYLMMGLLICGTVLFFCGLWECCCKRPKTDVELPPLNQPNTVLIINCQSQDSNPPRPPNYDDLDLPPSYTMLFGAKDSSSNFLEHEAESQNSNENNADESRRRRSVLVHQASNNSLRSVASDDSHIEFIARAHGSVLATADVEDVRRHLDNVRPSTSQEQVQVELEQKHEHNTIEKKQNGDDEET